MTARQDTGTGRKFFVSCIRRAVFLFCFYWVKALCKRNVTCYNKIHLERIWILYICLQLFI